MSIRAAAETNEKKECESEESLHKLTETHELLNAAYKRLLNEHEELQKMYMQIETDYEEIYAESTQRYTQASRLTAELDELKCKHAACLDRLTAAEKRLDAQASRVFIDSAVNTTESGSSYKSREEMESFYEAKFTQLNCEITQLKEKVSLSFLSARFYILILVH